MNPDLSPKILSYASRPPHAAGGRMRLGTSLLLVVGCMCLIIGALPLLRHVMPSAQPAVHSCAGHLKAVGMSLRLYAHRHGRLPVTLEQLADAGYIDRRRIVCSEKGLPFSYLPGQSLSAHSTSVFAYEAVTVHSASGGGHVLFADGSVRWLSASDHAAAITKTTRRLAGR